MVWTEALALAKAASNCYSPGPVATAPVVDSTCAVKGVFSQWVKFPPGTYRSSR